MMHLVIYDIEPKRDITSLLIELQSSASWLHYLDDAWIIISGENALQLNGRLRPHLLDTDRLIITEILKESEPAVGRLPQRAWDWINLWQNQRGGARSVYDVLQ